MTDQIIINNAQREKAKAFLRMHQTEGMFVIPNAWDAASAYIYEKAGFAAVATTSAGIAYALGYPDGEQVSLEDLLFVVKKITGRVQIPVSVDFERGYAEDPMHRQTGDSVPWNCRFKRFRLSVNSKKNWICLL